MKHGGDARVRTGDTELALSALETCGYLEARRLEQRLRVQWLEEGAPGVAPLARRVGMRDGPWGTAASALLTRYRAITEDVRAAYLAVIGAGQAG